ncbi:FUSC family protein [Gordonia sp. LUNF6]|uniref:FUSC family protein n=1 Tax=Gordonia sp. LUNF6 TaxID=3388658 RepID=UPI00399BE7AD
MVRFTANPVRALAGTDPGRTRLLNASGVAVAVLISTGCAWLIVNATHADGGYLAVGAFLAMQAGLSVRDATAPARVVTTALLVIPVVGGLAGTTLLAHNRYVEIAAFVVIGGVATWMRRFGPRWSAVGMIAFFSSFFALFLRPTVDDLGPLLLIGVGAVAASLIVKSTMLLHAPDRSLRLLMRQFRGAGDAAVRAAEGSVGRPRATLQARLDRLGDVAMAITDWQSRYDTAARTGLTAHELTRLVFDARTDLVQACLHLAQVPEPNADRELTALLDAMHRVLDTDLPASERSAASARARRTLEAVDPDVPGRFAVALLARAVESQVALREALESPHPAATAEPDTDVSSDEPTDAEPAVARDAEIAEAPDAGGGPHRFWREWTPTTRMAVQVMLAATLATVAGEAISASRWYWSVLTAFLVFVGVNTRAAILTRAYRRVIGTVCGVFVGFGFGIAVDGAELPLMLLCAVSVFCMVYLGPLNYAVMAFFVTVLLSSMYGLLGILNRHILELRLEETLTGAVIGVACAFLIFSSSSRPELITRIRAYFASLEEVLTRSGDVLIDHGPTTAVLDAAHRLDTDHRELETFVSSMAVSFAGGQRRTLRRSATALLKNAGVHADRLAQESVILGKEGGTAAFHGDAADAVRRGIDAVVAQSDAACRSLLHRRRDNPAKSEASETFDAVRRVPCRPHTPQYRAMLALSNLSITMANIERLRERD